jgi:hypothetical protein
MTIQPANRISAGWRCSATQVFAERAVRRQDVRAHASAELTA